jgi:hypothetical protein
VKELEAGRPERKLFHVPVRGEWHQCELGRTEERKAQLVRDLGDEITMVTAG